MPHSKDIPNSTRPELVGLERRMTLGVEASTRVPCTLFCTSARDDFKHLWNMSRTLHLYYPT
ncbi:hypothetical protein POX_h09837 [Penicillium oxalicum]|uniref:hypothetical protein n=1 Tax=Penicillium oxalicum TaxID=69781 RepID=UPI0020B6CE37|nr:hypothetical protein POX_h09837 [Penicillium oxalicum]KAI2786070.1 hypothetical protein POX_h09837 [Penicillium oxalicum]